MRKNLKMKKLFCLVLSCLLIWLIVPLNAFASQNDYVYDEIFKYDAENEAIIFSGISDGKIYKKLIVPASIGDNKIKKVTSMTFNNVAVEEIDFGDGIEEISAYAISHCSTLKKITIPESCKIIGGTSYMPAVEYCGNLETIEIYGEYEKLPLIVADCPNLKNVVFYGDVKNITNEFKYNFYNCEPRDKSVNPRVFTEKLNVTLQGKSGSNIEKFAVENGYNFVEIDKEQNTYLVNISKYTESNTHKVYNVYDTDYGTVLYLQVIGAPHATGPFLKLIRKDGEEINLSIGVSMETPWTYPEHNNIKISENGKYITFNVSFNERSAGNMQNGNYVVLHEAGTYYYKTNLETGVTIETHYEPLDTMGKDVISAWAKPEIDEAINIGFVPVELQNNYTQNITREEFAYLTVSFVMTNLSLSFEQLESQSEKYSAPRNKFDDSDNEYVMLAARMGIINGIGNNMFDPTSRITREQAATMLQRTYCLYSTNQNSMKQVVFDDSDKISEWALRGVEFCVSYDVMKGISDTQFAPQDSYTKEQAIATFLRLYKIREWEEQNRSAQYKKIAQSKEELISSLIKTGTEHIGTVVDNEYGIVVYLKNKLNPDALRARHYLVLIANDGSIYPLGDGSPVLEKMNGNNPPIENITLSDWGSVINYERVYRSSDFSQSSPDKPCDGILNVSINLITRTCKSEFKSK